MRLVMTRTAASDPNTLDLARYGVRLNTAYF
jgi:hypothetical protein